MPKELVVNASLEDEIRTAYIEDGEIMDLAIENQKKKGIVGNIYKGRVKRVLPGMQACFVDIGLEKAAFLYVDDIYVNNTSHGMDVVEDEEESSEGGDMFSSDGEDNESGSENDKTPRVRGEGRHKGRQKDEKSAQEKDMQFKIKPTQQQKIEELVKEGDELLVQVAKGMISSKGARLTCHISLPGRNLVFMPTLNHIGVSRKIGSYEERKRLRKKIEDLRPAETGFIVRTACEGISDEKLEEDVSYLVSLWEEIRQNFEKSEPAKLVHEELNVVLRAIRDLISEDVNRVIIDNPKLCQKVMGFVSRHMPRFKDVIYPYSDKDPIFHAYGIDYEIDRALERQVWLKSGGYIVIDQTEALVSIDINTGRFVGQKDLEETITQTNIEAVREIAYQLRIRNCGGIIIIDLIDMEKPENRRRVFKVLEEEIKKDRSRVNILKMSEFGLIQMTRKRTRDTLVRTMCEPCPYCEGKGYIRNRRTIGMEVLRDLLRDVNRISDKHIMLYVNPAVAGVIKKDEKDALENIEKGFQKTIHVKTDPSYHLEEYEIFSS
jgi:ribonuclease G